MDWSSSPEQTWTESASLGDSAVEEEPPPRTAGHMTDSGSDETDSSPSLQLHTLKEFEQHLNDLKKENFSLKLRIYFLEERIEGKNLESSDDVYRTNIVLKVEVESLKQELAEKQQQLDKALTAAESLTNHNETTLRKRCEEQEANHMELEEAQQDRSEAGRRGPMSGSQSRTSLLSLDVTMEDSPEASSLLPHTHTHSERVMAELSSALHSKQSQISELSGDKADLSQRVEQLEGQLEEMSTSLLQKEREAEFYQEELSRERLRIEQEMQTLIEEQQTQLDQYECAAGQCVCELQKAQQQVQTLQNKMHQSEANNTKLQEKLAEMEVELREVRQAAQLQERSIQDLTDSISTRDRESQELYQVIEGQNATLCKLREMAHHTQITHTQSQAPEGGAEAGVVARLQAELLGVQSSLFSLGLELEASQRSLKQSQRQAEDLGRSRDRLASDLQEALKHHQLTDKHNQDLSAALQQSSREQQERESVLRERQAESVSLLEERERTISQLRQTLQDKDRQLQERCDDQDSVSKPRDALLEKLRERIKERDRALERAVDERFVCVEEREAQVRRLQSALREKDRDQERLQSILSNNEETITSLDALLHSKDLELQRSSEALRNLQSLQSHQQETHTHTLRERDTLITQLNNTLDTHRQETQDLRARLLSQVQTGSSSVLAELKARLEVKERVFQELLSDRGHQAQLHQAHIQELLSTISTRDHSLQDCSDRLSQVIDERTNQLQELRRQLSSRERELSELRRERESEGREERERLQCLLKEKEAFIQELLKSREGVLRSSSPAGAAERLQDELQLMVKKEREAQRELSALRSSVVQLQQQALKQGARFEGSAQGAAPKDCLDHQTVLEQLISEYHCLNQALRTEKNLYQSLSQLHTGGDSQEKTQTLHTELDSVQALRGQLEEVLARTRNTALALERGAGGPEGAEEATREEEEEGDDEDGSSSDEFTDSIEDDEARVSSRTLSSRTVSSSQLGGVFGGPGAPVPSQKAERPGQMNMLEKMHPLLEQTRSEEEEALREARERPGGLRPGERPGLGGEHRSRLSLEEDEEEEDMEEEEIEDEEEEEDMGGASRGKRGAPCVRLREGRSQKRHCTRPHSLDLGTLLSHCQEHTHTEAESGAVTGEVGGFWQLVEAGLREHASRLRADLALSRQETRELQERLMVSEATVHAQAEQLKDYRELLTESSVPQASKQVQVDLQDLGYETSGRSENEEREETSSPEFDDLEMCTTLTHQQDFEGGGGGGGWYHGNDSVGGAYEEGEEPGPDSLQRLVEDLRSQLSRCHKVIRTLQLRVRSLSSTSDYASSLERTPRKVNWAFEASPVASGLEEDEGWASDSLGPRLEPKPSRELRELVSRVTSLEAQLKSSRLDGKGGLAEEEKCATWPGKYNTLIQAQARELSHLRQRMREGRGVCHILTQHLGDTTKAFEELLRANDIDYYMGQSFREQLAQSSALAHRVETKISGRDHPELQDDKMGHELLALRLSKELQQKDQIIESLHTKLQQRPDTPSSCPALSQTTDQSDRTSFVSDECRTNEDLELCSDVDAASEYQEEQRQGAGHGSRNAELHLSLPPSHGLKSSRSCPSMLCSAPALAYQSSRDLLSGPVSCSLPGLAPAPDLWGQRVTFDPHPRAISVTASRQEMDTLHRQMNQSFASPHVKTLSTLLAPAHSDPSHYSPVSHHAVQQYQLGYGSLKPNPGLASSGALWDMENMLQPIKSFSESGYHSGSNHTGVELMEEHLREARCLRQRLEESIRTNERLRLQLEERLAGTGRDGGAPTNIYIQGLDSVSQLSNELRLLKEENLALQSRLQASAEACEEVGRLREAVLAGHARLKQAELEAGQWKEELRRLESHSQEQSQHIHTLRLERQACQERSHRLQQEVSLLQQQLGENRELLLSLQSELQVYDRVCAKGKGCLSEGPLGSAELGDLLGEVRNLRAQLQNSLQENSALKQLELHKQLEQRLGGGGGGGGGGSPRTPSLSTLTASPQRDSFYRRQLLHDPAPSPPVRDIGLFTCGSPYMAPPFGGPPYTGPPYTGPYPDLEDSHSTANDPLEPHSDLEGEAPDGSFSNPNGRHAVGHVDDYSSLQQQVLEGRSLVQRMETALSQSLVESGQEQALDYVCVRSLLSDTRTLRQILEEAVSLLRMFWRAALPSSERSLHILKKERGLQEELVSLTLRMAEKEEVLQETVMRLRSTSRTKESMEHFIVNQLCRTRDVLKKARTNLEKNELRLSSFSSSSSPNTVEEPGSTSRERPTNWGFLKIGDTPEVSVVTGRKRGSQCLLEAVTC